MLSDDAMASDQQYDVLYKGASAALLSLSHCVQAEHCRANTPTPLSLSFSVSTAVVLVGDPSVGKTNLLATFLAAVDESKHTANVDGSAKGFSSVRKPTIGVEFGTKVVQHPNGKRIKAQIWDTGAWRLVYCRWLGQVDWGSQVRIP